MQQKGGSVFGVNSQGNFSEHFVSQNIRPAVVDAPYRQAHEDINIQNRKEFLQSWHTTTDIFQENDARLKLFNNNGGEPLRNYKNQDTHSISNNSSQVCGISRQSTAPRSFPRPFNTWGGNAEFSHGLEGVSSSNVDPNRYQFKNYEVLNQDITSTGGFEMESKEPFPKFGSSQLFSYVNNDNYNSKAPSIQSPGTVFVDALSGNNWRQNSTVLTNGTPYSSDPRNLVYHNNDQGYKSLNTQASNFVMNPEISTSKDTNLPKCSDIFATPIDNVVKDQNDSYSKFDEWDKIKDGNTLPEAVEKLWDGSLQLNSCVTASMMALFKSGERIPEVNWSELIEVKGKVRLDAFEKYIQDLPRSRNRGLMVISLAWKSGSSQSGLKGMKEVAEKYEQGEKVGLAQLSTGIDLYICPTSDSIINLLVKYGFLKATSASEDGPGSLIGCVVWRKTLFPTPKPEEKHMLSPLPATEPPPTYPLLQNQPLPETDEGGSDPSCTTPVAAAKDTEPPALWSPSHPAEPCPPAGSDPISELEKPAESDDDLPEYDFTYAETESGMVLPLKEYEFCKYESSSSPVASFSKKRSLFDDDDMPEWLPPELDPPASHQSGSGYYQSRVVDGVDREKRRNFGHFYGENGMQ